LSYIKDTSIRTIGAHLILQQKPVPDSVSTQMRKRTEESAPVST